MKILIVDDCSTTRRLLGMYLRSQGYEVAYAENGLDGIEKIGTDGPNLVITDLNMPYMDGIEFVRSVRSDPARTGLPILMVTTAADPAERERAVTAGVDGYLVKPVTADMVSRHIRQILQKLFSQGGSPHA